MKKKSASQTAQKLTNKVILLAITALALYASPSTRGIEVCNQILFSSWTTPGAANWFDSPNWCGGVPLCHSFTCISNGGTAQVGTGTTANACETFLGQYQCDPFSCPNSRGSSGNLSVDGGTLNTCNELHVGYQGMGTLKITNGGLVSTTGGADIAAGAASNGAATVNGATSQWTVTGGLYVGGTNGTPGGTGLLTLSNGGKVSVANVYVYQSGTLAGNGRVDATNGTTVDGTLAPSGGGTTLTFGGALGLNILATTQCNVTPQDPSTTPQVSVSGQVSLGGRLSVTMTGDFSSAPTRFTLLNAGSVNSSHRTFDSTSITYPTNQCWTPQITYVTDNNGQYHVYLDRIVCAN